MEFVEMIFEFPFLIGTVRTLSTLAQYWMATCVSIPHRYGKNRVGGLCERRFGTFPFLIGTVRTYIFYDLGDDVSRFPFLIGTVRTYNER